MSDVQIDPEFRKQLEDMGFYLVERQLRGGAWSNRSAEVAHWLAAQHREKEEREDERARRTERFARNANWLAGAALAATVIFGIAALIIH